MIGSLEIVNISGLQFYFRLSLVKAQIIKRSFSFGIPRKIYFTLDPYFSIKFMRKKDPLMSKTTEEYGVKDLH